MKKNIIRKCFLISFVAVAIMFLASTFVTYWVTRDNIKKNLVADATFYARWLDAASVGSMQGLTYRGAMRLTVISNTGEVLFESDTTAPLENHANREEIKFAQSGKPKVVERYSKTLGQSMFYYAVQFGDAADGGVVRLAVFSGEIWSHFLKSLPFAVIAMLFAVLISYVFAKQLSAEVTGQFKNIRKSLQSVGVDYVGISATMADKEIFGVLKEIDRLFLLGNRQMARIKEEEHKLDYVVNHLLEGVIALGAKGQIVLLNRAANRMFDGDGKAKTLGYLIDNNALLERLTALNLAGKSETFDIKRNGKELRFSVISQTEQEGTEVSTVIVIADVTKERLALKERAEFFQNASHELKTPLTSIEGLSELLLETDVAKPKSDKYLKRINGEAKRMTGLVQDMLYVSDLENNRRPTAAEPVDLAELTEDCFERYRAEAEEKRLTLTVSGKASMLFDKRNAAELIGNLVGNAVHYNKECGAVTVLLEETQQMVKLQVKDSGIGIAERDLPRITERFYRVDKSRSKETGGTGLGLSIVKHITERYRGDLTVESKLGEGTLFTIVFYRMALAAIAKEGV